MNERAVPPDQDVRDKALDLSHDVFLAAGAGTGKTTVLVGRYMAALEAGMSPHEIVAVTFTVKAAAEMRKRLREQCEEKVEAEDGEEARHWRRIKTQLETAPIHTIHGFCGMLLREFALAGGLDPQYVVLEERPTWLLLRRVVRETLLQRLADGVESATVLVGEYGRQGSEKILQDVLRSRERFAKWLEAPPSAEEMLAYWEQIEPELLGENLNDGLTSHELGKAVRVLRENPPVAADAKFAEERETVLRSLERASAETEAEAVRAAIGKAYEAAAVPKRGGKADDWGGAESLKLVKDALNEVKQVLGKAQAAEKTAAFWAEASACSEAFQAAKRERSALDFTDMQLEAARLLKEHPDVANKCQQRYKQVMVDEFQDTNALQWDIVRAVSGFDSEKTDREGPRLFVVGDAKQSIYGFRDADVRVFRQTRKEFKDRPAGVDELALKAGFRSTAELSGFHNWLFAQEAVMGPPPKPDYAAEFEPVVAQRAPPDDGLSGEILITDVWSDDEGGSGDEERNADWRRQKEAANIAKRLHEIVRNWLILGVGDEVRRPVKYGDIAMLFRAMTDVNKYERALHHYGIPFYTVAGKGFWQRSEVRDLLNMVRALDNRNDSVALAAVLRSPMFGFDDNELYRAALAGETLAEGLRVLAGGECEPKASWAAKRLAEFRTLSGTVALSVLLQRIVEETGYSAAMAAQFQGERRLANIEKLIDLARGFERDGNYTLGEFVSYVETVSEEEEAGEGDAPLSRADANAVQLLTIHKAKGLEWPVVVVPDIGRGSRGSQKALVTSNDYGVCARVGRDGDSSDQCAIGELIRASNARRDAAEEQRVFYVAATRARDYLILSAPIDRSKKRSYPAESWLGWLAEACGWDLAEGKYEGIAKGSWRMKVEALEPSPLPRASARRAPMAERHEAEVLSGRSIGEQAVEPALRRQVKAVGVAPADIEALTVTSLALYRRCRLAYELEFIKGMPRMDAQWGLGQLEEEAAETVVGTFAHRVLEVVGRRGIEALDGAMEIADRSPEIGGKLTRAQRAEVHKWVEGYLSTPTYGKITDNAEHLRSEVPVSFTIDGVVIEGKIDALAEMGDERAHVVDYKTGGPRAEQGLPAYEFQIGLYCEALRRNRGRLPDEATLVYLSAGEATEVAVESTTQVAMEETEKLLEELRAGDFGHCRGPWCAHCPVRTACEYASQGEGSE